MAFIYFLLIAFLVGASSILSSTGEITNKGKKGFSIITKRGWFFFIINIGIIAFSVFQYVQNEIDVNKKEVEANTKQLQRDSVLRIQYDSSLYIMKLKYDSGHTNIVFTIANALGKYGYKLDSSNQRLVKLIRDSAKTKIILPNDPVLIVCPNGGIELINRNNKKDFYRVSICSKDAGSSQYDINCSMVIADSLNNLSYKGTFNNFIPFDAKIPNEIAYERYFDIIYDHSYSFLYIHLKGKYKNLDGTKYYETSDMYYYNRNGNTSGMIAGKTKSIIIEFVNRVADR